MAMTQHEFVASPQISDGNDVLAHGAVCNYVYIKASENVSSSLASIESIAYFPFPPCRFVRNGQFNEEIGLFG